MLRLFLRILLDETGATLTITRKTANTLITASGFNTNYDEIEAVVNALDGDNFDDGAITAAKLNDDVVRADYGLKRHTTGALQVDVSDTNPGLELTDGGVRAKVDDSSIERASGGLQIKALGVTNAMLAGSIADSNLSQITTASKVHGTAITGLASLPSGAGVIPAANTPTFATLVAAKVYDSGWFAITKDTAYAKTHSLGTTKVATFVYVSNSSDGSGLCSLAGDSDAYARTFGTYVAALTTTTITLRTATIYVYAVRNSSGTDTYAASGYARIIMLALE